MKKRIVVTSLSMVLFTSTCLLAKDFTGSIKIGIFDSETKAMEQIKVPIIPAIQAAKAAVPGQVVKAKVDEEDSYLVYEVKILQTNGKKKEVFVDPITGKVLKIKDD
ncbi:MAG TPA: hypothetical protein ENK89_02430 [Desulfobulbaceae bacterium]|nr:hypothetical protein [Desulfobulbaceae bacterium]